MQQEKKITLQGKVVTYSQNVITIYYFSEKSMQFTQFLTSNLTPVLSTAIDRNNKHRELISSFTLSEWRKPEHLSGFFL